METVAERLYSLEEYFAFCDSHEGRFEFVNGEIVEMSGETLTANQIAGNVHFHLRAVLHDQPYLFMQNAVKVQINDGTIFRIPDFMICGEQGNAKFYTATPLLIVEVLSESSAHTDRVVKLHEYCQIPSLQYYIIIAQDACYAEVYAREGDRWYVEFFDRKEDAIPLPFFSTSLPLNVVFAKVNFGGKDQF